MNWLRDRLRAWLCPELLEESELLPEEVEAMRRDFMEAEMMWKQLRDMLHAQNEQIRRSLH